jgi:hypothetical protein
MLNTDTLVHETAIVALVLGRRDYSVRGLEAEGLGYISAVRDGLLLDLEYMIREQGRFDVPPLIDAKRLATLLQTELGSAADVVTETTPDRGEVQYLILK